MSAEQRIYNLIEVGWYMLDSNFDPVAFQSWRRRALECLTDLLGPDHAYATHFKHLQDQNERMSCLVGSGILTAAGEEVAQGRQGQANPDCPPCAAMAETRSANEFMPIPQVPGTSSDIESVKMAGETGEFRKMGRRRGQKKLRG